MGSAWWLAAGPESPGGAGRANVGSSCAFPLDGSPLMIFTKQAEGGLSSLWEGTFSVGGGLLR